MPRHLLPRIVVFSLYMLAVPAYAQPPLPDESGMVSGNGVVAISRSPEVMRVQVALLAKGATLKDALASVKTRSEAARKLLMTLGADKDSIKVDSTKITPKSDQEQQRRMQRMMQQGGKAARKSKKVADPVLVSAQLTAEWKLEAKNPDELLLAVHALQEKIRAADLAGMKDAEKLSPEQEELLEEAGEPEMGGYGSNNQRKAGEPVFLFVGRISDAERDRALADAFQKAKVQAARLAKAAGVDLGNLRSLTAHNTRAGGYDEYGNFNQYAYQASAQSGGDDDGSNDSEALGVEPGPVKISVSVTAAFDLKRK